MAPVMSSPSNGVSLTPDVAFITKNRNFLSRCSIPRKTGKQTLPLQRYTLPLSTSIRLFPQFRIDCILKPKLRTHIASASGTEVAVEEADLSPADNDASDTASETSEEPSAKSDISPTESKRQRPVRKSEMPPVKNEELIPGATFTGKVRSIQPFGAFVDFGAFTDGLVHVSRLSDSYVKDVASVVTVGQEVTVRLIEVNTETGRISLSMRESDDTSKPQQQRAADKSRSPRRMNQKSNQNKEDTRKRSNFVKGQELEGTVKNTTRAGAFISLPEGEEGFLPTSEEAIEGFVNMTGGSSLEVGQEVRVRVLRITRGQVTLTMKKEEDLKALDVKLNQGVVHTATNPFVVAFRKNEVISAFLDERDNENEQVEKAEEVAKDADTVVSVIDDTLSKALEKEEDLEKIPENFETKNDEGSPHIEDQITKELSPIEAKENKEEEAELSEKVAALSSEIVEEAKEKDVDDAILKDELSGDDVVEAKEEDVDDGKVKDELTENKGEPQLSGDDVVVQAKEEDVDDGIVKDELMENEGEPQLSGDDVVEEVTANTVDEVIEKDEVQTEITDSTEPSVAEEEEKTAAPNPEKNESIESSSAPIDSPDPETESTESAVRDDVSDNIGNEIAVNEVEQTLADPQQNGNISNPSEQSSDASPKETTAKAAISPALVKQLREETGAGMMDCKKALSETGGDIVKAQEYLRKKGLASAEKKASRATAEGRIGSYIHDSRIGVLIEVNCETDFVARGDIFKELVEDLAMQVAAYPQVQVLNTEDVPKEIVDKEREIEMQKEDLLSKPEQIRSKIVDGRIRKRLEELALLEQPFVKDDKVAVKDWVKQTISTIGENIKVKRFVRYNLGEGLEKKSQDFAAEVAAQTAAKPVSTPVKQEPAETKETVEERPKAVVSAALVKQLREETGAGMMDCKKALSETGGDLEKAQEYLRKKGLSAADKKSSRLAAEGRIGSYIHDSRIGVLIEVNCETDFVGRSQNFKELVDDLAMQVVACPHVQYISVEDIPESIINKEKELEMQREDLQSKPENIREKIVEGRISKRLGELALLEQPFIKNDSMLIKDLVKQTVAALGENIKVRRFVRFTLGETTNENEKNEA